MHFKILDYCKLNLINEKRALLSDNAHYIIMWGKSDMGNNRPNPQACHLGIQAWPQPLVASFVHTSETADFRM